VAADGLRNGQSRAVAGLPRCMPAKARDRAAPDRSILNVGERPMSESRPLAILCCLIYQWASQG